jgi:hypothetical protein
MARGRLLHDTDSAAFGNQEGRGGKRLDCYLCAQDNRPEFDGAALSSDGGVVVLLEVEPKASYP